MTELVFMLGATFLGALAATLLAYFRKKWEGKIKKFDIKYIGHLIGTCAYAFAVDIFSYAAWRPPDEFIAYDVLIYLLAFFWGYGGNNAQKGAEKYIRLLQTLSKGIGSPDGE